MLSIQYRLHTRKARAKFDLHNVETSGTIAWMIVDDGQDIVEWTRGLIMESGGLPTVLDSYTGPVDYFGQEQWWIRTHSSPMTISDHEYTTHKGHRILKSFHADNIRLDRVMEMSVDGQKLFLTLDEAETLGWEVLCLDSIVKFRG